MGRPRKDRPRRPNATGRSDKVGRFVMLPHRILESAAYASLDLVARGLLAELVMLYDGDNNGSLWLGARDATARLGLTDCRPVQRGFADLIDRGFVTLAKEAHFTVKAADTSRARCWRLTWLLWAECPVKTKRAPTNEWERYAVPPGDTKETKRINRRADKRLRTLAKYRKENAAGRLPVVNFTTTEANMAIPTPDPVVKFTTARAANDAIPPFSVVGESPTHVDGTMGKARSCSPADALISIGWWTTCAEARIVGQILLLFIVAQNWPGQIAKAA